MMDVETTKDYWNPETETFEPRTIIIKKITVTCGQCKKDYDLTEQYVDVMRMLDGWLDRCPHCGGMNGIAFAIVKLFTESSEVRKKRFSGMFKSILEKVYQRHGWKME